MSWREEKKQLTTYSFVCVCVCWYQDFMLFSSLFRWKININVARCFVPSAMLAFPFHFYLFSFYFLFAFLCSLPLYLAACACVCVLCSIHIMLFVGCLHICEARSQINWVVCVWRQWCGQFSLHVQPYTHR